MLQIDKCFGFDTAVEEAQRALMAAKVEAMSAYRGIGLVKLMGRQSGFIAMQVQPLGHHFQENAICHSTAPLKIRLQMPACFQGQGTRNMEMSWSGGVWLIAY